MEWTADVSSGEWLKARLDDGFDTMHGVVPRGFAAYARVFHPAHVQPPGDAPEQPASWAQAADAFGTQMHPLAQWHRIVRAETPQEATGIAPNGAEYRAPDTGEMPTALLAAIAGHLVAHTESPSDGFAAVWEGWGELFGGSLRFGWRSDGTSFSEESPAILPADVEAGPRLGLPDRNHVLFSAAPAAFADPNWVLDAPWRDRRSEAIGFAPSARHPALVWPKDHAWVLVSEIDFDSTVIGGSAELIAALGAERRIEALPLPPNADLTWAGDTING